MNLKDDLIAKNKVRWLDIGSGSCFDQGFEYIDIFPEGIVDQNNRAKYHRLDIIHAKDELLKQLGQYDLIRLQHTIEHFTFEDCRCVLKNCAKLLQKGGLILITAPDLRIYINRYLTDTYKSWSSIQAWANSRIPVDAPNSAYFSMFAHSILFEPHKWCYDYEGIAYMLHSAEDFKNIQELKLEDELASIPFTHNRPEEDVCVIAEKS